MTLVKSNIIIIKKWSFYKVLPGISKTLVLVLTTFMPITEASKKNEMLLEKIPYIHYLFYFQKNTVKGKTLIDSGKKVDAMNPDYVSKLGLKVCPINVGA